MRKLHSLLQRGLASTWAPIFGKAFAGLGALSILALFGSGALDGLIDASPAQARPTARSSAEGGSERSSAPIPSTSVSGSPRAPVAGSAAASASASAGAARGSALLPDGRLVLNEASAAEIDRLPGIGLKRAEAIVALREKLGGRFRRLEDLTRVRGIKRKALAKLRPHLVLDRPAPSPSPEGAGAH
jgi:competence protein ComEA